MNKTLLRTDCMSIGHGKQTLIDNIHIEVNEGDCIMLCGANGSGKTTLLKAIAGMSSEACEIAMIPARIPKVEGFTLKEFISVSCFSHSGTFGKLPPDDNARMHETIELLGMSHLTDRDISTLSDGEFQKGCIAAALIRQARILLLDEPTAFLDAENRISVLKTLRTLCKGDARRAVIFSTHDLHDGATYCNKAIAIGSDGMVRCEKDKIASVIKTIFH